MYNGDWSVKNNIPDIFRNSLFNRGLKHIDYTVSGTSKQRVVKYKIPNKLYSRVSVDDDATFNIFFGGGFVMVFIMLFWLIPNITWSNVLFHLCVCLGLLFLYNIADSYKEAVVICTMWLCWAMLTVGIMGWISVYGNQTETVVIRIGKNLSLIYPKWLFKFTFVWLYCLLLSQLSFLVSSFITNVKLNK